MTGVQTCALPISVSQSRYADFYFFCFLFFYVYCEISLLVTIGSAIGVLPLILLMIAISAAGLWLLKLQGTLALLDVRKQIAQGSIPTQAVGTSVFFAIAGICLLIPGFLSDILALLLILPVTRNLLQRWVMKYFSRKVKVTSFYSSYKTHEQPTTFDAEFERKQDEDKRLR